MDTLSGIAVVALLAAFFVFGLVGYLRGKSVRSCCDLPTSPRAKEGAK